jgi:hypothetical protein
MNSIVDDLDLGLGASTNCIVYVDVDVDRERLGRANLPRCQVTATVHGKDKKKKDALHPN